VLQLIVHVIHFVSFTFLHSSHHGKVGRYFSRSHWDLSFKIFLWS